MSITLIDQIKRQMDKPISTSDDKQPTVKNNVKTIYSSKQRFHSSERSGAAPLTQLWIGTSRTLHAYGVPIPLLSEHLFDCHASGGHKSPKNDSCNDGQTMTNPKRNENEYNTCTLKFMQSRQPDKRSTPYNTKIHEENTPKPPQN